MSSDLTQSLSTLDISPSSSSSSAPSAYSPELDSRTIMISNIPPTLSESGLSQFINEVAPGFTSLALIMNHKIRRKFAFAVYPSESLAEAAIQNMNCMEIGQFEIRVKKKSTGVVGNFSGNIYIKGIPESIRARHLFDILGSFGTITSVKIPSVEEKGKQLRMDYGFVQYASEEAAEKAIAFLNASPVMGVQLKAEKYLPLSERHKEESKKDFVLKFPAATLQEDIEGALREEGVEVEKMDFKAPKEGKLFSIAFLSLGEGSEGVHLHNAINKFNSEKGAKVKVESLLPRMKLIQRRMEEERNTWKVMKKRNVFVKGFPKSWEEAELRKLCEKYGEIESMFLTASTRDAVHEKNAGYGFVSYKKEEDAAEAIENLNGMFLESSIVEASQALGPHERKPKRRFEGDRDFDKNKGFRHKREFGSGNKMHFGNFHSNNNAMEIMVGSGDKITENTVSNRLREMLKVDEGSAREAGKTIFRENSPESLRKILANDMNLQKEFEEVMKRME